jgi:hypothetical protein
MRELGARLRVEGLDDDESKALQVTIDSTMLAGMEISTWRTDAGDFDVLTGLRTRDGLQRNYRDLIPTAVDAEVVGIAVRLAGLGDIIESEEWANRPKDRFALVELYRIAAQRDSES